MESNGRIEAFFMVLVQLAYATISVLVKLVTKDGMSIQVLTAYRFIFGAAFSFFLVLIFERCIQILLFSIHENKNFGSLNYLSMAKTLLCYF